MVTESPSWLAATRPGDEKRITIADVAREAGVNKGTVSRALRGMAGVGSSTRARILATAERLDFAPSEIASALATGTSRTVGILLPTLRSWYFTTVAVGASQVLQAAGYRVELVDLEVDSDDLDADSAQVRRIFAEQGAGRGRDAVLFAGNISVDPTAGQAGSGHLPAAAVRSPVARVPGVYVDHTAGGRLAAEHLIGLGHRRIAVVDGRMPAKADVSVWAQRTDGFVAALRAAGLPDPLLLTPGNCFARDGEAVAAAIAVTGDRPTAVFCHTDELAFGFIAGLRRAGLRCPDDISVVGFDDHPMSQWWGLTTVSQHADQQGERAAEALLDVLRGATSEARPDLAVELVVRDSAVALTD